MDESANQALVAALFVPTEASLEFITSRLRTKVIEAAAVLLTSTQEVLADRRLQRREGRGDASSSQPSIPEHTLSHTQATEFMDTFVTWVASMSDEYVDTYKKDFAKFWRAHSPNKPEVQHLLRAVCSIQATSAPAEREFSAVSLVLDHGRRGSLLPDNVDRIAAVRNYANTLDEAGITKFAKLLAERILILRESNDEEWYELYDAAAHGSDDEFPAFASVFVQNQ